MEEFPGCSRQEGGSQYVCGEIIISVCVVLKQAFRWAWVFFQSEFFLD